MLPNPVVSYVQLRDKHNTISFGCVCVLYSERLSSLMSQTYGSRTVFTARRVCIARTMPWQDVRPSVCLSVRPTHAGIMSKQLYISSKFSRHRVAPAFQFFHTKRDGNIPTGTPSKGGGRRMQGNMKKIAIFNQYLAVSGKRCKIEPQLLWKANRKAHPSFRMVQF